MQAVDESLKRTKPAGGGCLNSEVGANLLYLKTAWALPCGSKSPTRRSFGPRGSKTPTWWSTEPVVRCRIVGIEPFQRRQLDLARPESAFPQVGKSHAFAQPEFMRA